MPINNTIIRIISRIDEWLEQNNEREITAVEAAVVLHKVGLLKDSSSRPGKPLRDKLRRGEIPNAYQKGKYWFISHSHNFINRENSAIENLLFPQKKDENVTPISEFDESSLLDNVNFRPVDKLDICDIPNVSGIYAIRIRDISILPEKFRCELENRDENLLYVGIASQSLRERLWNDELHAKKSATFFRSIGAMLGMLPPKGSLSLKSYNYKFSAEDNKKIIEWMEQSLLINFVTNNDDIKSIEKVIIKKYQPIINIEHNPYPFTPLKDMRAECRNYARLPNK